MKHRLLWGLVAGVLLAQCDYCSGVPIEGSPCPCPDNYACVNGHCAQFPDGSVIGSDAGQDGSVRPDAGGDSGLNSCTTGQCSGCCGGTGPGGCVAPPTNKMCGAGNSTCVDCTAVSAGHVCTDAGQCGCWSDSDCPLLQSCSFFTHTCSNRCNNTCNGGCCDNNSNTCFAGNTNTECGPVGGGCRNCTRSNSGHICLSNKSCGCGSDQDCSCPLVCATGSDGGTCVPGAPPDAGGACTALGSPCPNNCCSGGACGGCCTFALCSAAGSCTIPNGSPCSGCSAGSPCSNCIQGQCDTTGNCCAPSNDPCPCPFDGGTITCAICCGVAGSCSGPGGGTCD